MIDEMVHMLAQAVMSVLAERLTIAFGGKVSDQAPQLGKGQQILLDETRRGRRRSGVT